MKPTLARKIFCIAALFCTAIWSAHAVNVVADPGFEASADGMGPFPFSASWTNVDASGFSGVDGQGPPLSHSGANYAFLGSDTGGSLSQLLNTVPTQSYDLSFWLANDISPGTPGNSFQVMFNGVSVFSLTNAGAFGYTQFTISGLLATGPTTNLEFLYQHSNDFWRLDDISVDGPSVPESFSTIWLALPAFGALGLVHFSRARTRKSLARS